MIIHVIFKFTMQTVEKLCKILNHEKNIVLWALIRSVLGNIALKKACSMELPI